MLSELYRYALANGLAARPGFRRKRIAGHMMLSKDGKFLGFDPSVEGTALAPDIGSAANGTGRCNILVEKAGIVLNMVRDEKKDRNIPVKHDFFVAALKDGSASEPRFLTAAEALKDAAALEAMRVSLKQAGLSPASPVGIEVDGIPLESSGGYFEWWDGFRARFSQNGQNGLFPRCMITGRLAPAMATVPKVTGLLSVGGHTSGDALICFDKDAFCSYGLRQSANAAVSEKAMTAVNAALTELIARSPKPLGGARYVHWYSKPVGGDADLVPILLSPGFEIPEDEEDGAGDGGGEAAALLAARRLIEGAHNGELPEYADNRYYILLLSGAGGRIMIRGWYEGPYETLYENVSAWFRGLRIVSANGKSLTKPPRLSVLCTKLLKPGGDAGKIWERVDKELSGLTPAILSAAINGTPLPDAVASRALACIRSGLLSGKDGDKSEKAPDGYACQLLKIWLLRKKRRNGGETNMSETVNPDYQSTAYHCGRLMAVYAAIQREALGPGVGAGVIQRYYASASTSPALVIGKLSALSQHHLAKLENRGSYVRYSKALDEVYSKIREKIPASLNLTQQSEFAVGYYQQRAALFAPTPKIKESANDEGGKENAG